MICFRECQDDLMTYFGLQFATVETSKLFFKYIAKEFLLPQQTLTAKWQQLANLPSIIVGSMWRRNVISSRGSTRMDFSWVQGCGWMITSWAETIFASWWPKVELYGKARKKWQTFILVMNYCFDTFFSLRKINDDYITWVLIEGK